jgi:hypothetical protein
MNYLARGPVRQAGIDSKENADRYRHDNARITNCVMEVSA